MEAGVRCPQCGSTRVYKDGLRYTQLSQIQRYLCRSCGHRFSEKPNIDRQTNGNRQLCVLAKAKKLVAVKETQALAGEHPTQQGKILEYAWRLKKRGLTERTIENRIGLLNKLVKLGADLADIDSVDTVLATEQWTASSKRAVVSAYQGFAKAYNIVWTAPKVRYQPKQPFIPLESELDQLIASSGKRLGTYLQALKDTGARAGEASALKWTGINDANSTISINNAEKGSLNRTIKVTSKTIAMLKALPKKYGENVFSSGLARAMRSSFGKQRRRVAANTQNPRLMQIHFHTFRHWKATIEYRRTRNILYVKHLLGHKRLENTEIYTHLIEFESSDYDSAHAQTLDEEDKLIEAGFEFVRYDDSRQIAIYRKRK